MKRPPDCAGCPADPGTSSIYNPKRTGPFVPPHLPSGPLNSPGDLTPADLKKVDLVVVGMAPSFREVDHLEPLVGPSFAEMRRAFGPLLDTIRLLKLNYVNCRTWRPGKTVDYVNRTPTATEAKACVLRWLVPILRVMAETERQGHTIHLWVLGAEAFKVVFQEKFGTFSGSKSSRGQRMNRRNHSYDLLADRIERWATKTTRKKDRHCKDCNVLLTEPRVRLCPRCREAKRPAKKKKAASPDRPSPSSVEHPDPPSPSSPSPREPR